MEMWTQTDEIDHAIEIWLDTLNEEVIQEAEELGILSGVTTNPSLMSKSFLNIEDQVERLLDIQSGFVAVQVLSNTAEEMLKETRTYHEISDRVIVKIPATKAGFLTIKNCRERHMLTMATGVVSTRQALLAGIAGADYVAPYLGTMLANGIDPFEMIKNVHEIYDKHTISSVLLCASVRDINWIDKVFSLGAEAVTLSENVFEEFTEDHPLTVQKMQQFEKEWNNSKVLETV
jgi:transaldolase